MNTNEVTKLLKLIDTTLIAIIEMEDVDTFDEQLDCINGLKKLRNKLKDKEAKE